MTTFKTVEEHDAELAALQKKAEEWTIVSKETNPLTPEVREKFAKLIEESPDKIAHTIGKIGTICVNKKGYLASGKTFESTYPSWTYNKKTWYFFTDVRQTGTLDGETLEKVWSKATKGLKVDVLMIERDGVTVELHGFAPASDSYVCGIFEYSIIKDMDPGIGDFVRNTIYYRFTVEYNKRTERIDKIKKLKQGYYSITHGPFKAACMYDYSDGKMYIGNTETSIDELKKYVPEDHEIFTLIK